MKSSRQLKLEVSDKEIKKRKMETKEDTFDEKDAEHLREKIINKKIQEIMNFPISADYENFKKERISIKDLYEKCKLLFGNVYPHVLKALHDICNNPHTDIIKFNEELGKFLRRNRVLWNRNVKKTDTKEKERRLK